MNKANLLSRIPLFASMSQIELEDMARLLEMRQLSKGTVFIEEGSPGKDIFLLLDGSVEVIKSYGKEGERLLGIRGPGTLFGEMGLFSQAGERTATVRAASPVLLCVLSAEDFEKLLIHRPKAAVEMMRILSRRLELSENETILDLKEKNRQLTEAYRQLQVAQAQTIEAYHQLQAAQAQIIEKEKLEHELSMARQIQQSVLPRILPILEDVQLGALMEPARLVGGDFYDFILLPGDRVGVVVGDVSDKGIPAAFVMALVYSLIRAEASRDNSPARVLVAANEHLINMGVTDMFATLIYGLYHRSTGEFTYARAGHPIPMLLDSAARDLPVRRSIGQPIGIFSPVALDIQTVTVPVGGAMLLYSDGLTEAVNAAGEYFGEERAQQALQTCYHATAQDICQQLWRNAADYIRPAAQQDDITLVCLKRRG